METLLVLAECLPFFLKRKRKKTEKNRKNRNLKKKNRKKDKNGNGKKRKKTKFPKRRKRTEEKGKNRKRHRSGDPFCETPTFYSEVSKRGWREQHPEYSKIVPQNCGLLLIGEEGLDPQYGRGFLALTPLSAKPFSKPLNKMARDALPVALQKLV